MINIRNGGDGNGDRDDELVRPPHFTWIAYRISDRVDPPKKVSVVFRVQHCRVCV